MTQCSRAAVPAALVSGVREALRTPAGRGLVGTVDHPAIGSYEALRSPVRINGSRPRLRTPPPALGEHTDKVLKELLEK